MQHCRVHLNDRQGHTCIIAIIHVACLGRPLTCTCRNFMQLWSALWSKSVVLSWETWPISGNQQERAIFQAGVWFWNGKTTGGRGREQVQVPPWHVLAYNFQVKKGKVCGLRTGRVVRDLVAGKFVDGFCVQRVLFERPLTPPWTLLP